MRRLCSLLSLSVASLIALQAHADTCNGFTNNLVANCSFEAGSFSSWTGTATTASPNYAGVDSAAPFAGQYEAYLGSIGSTITLSQTLSTTPGNTYLIEFALGNDTSPSTGYTNSFTVLFGGTSIFSETAVNEGDYTLFSAFGTSSANTAALSFVSRNDVGYFDLDSISAVAATPEPSSLLLLTTGAMGSFAVARRRFRRFLPRP